MTPICSVPMRSKRSSRCIRSNVLPLTNKRRKGFTFTELIVVVVMVSLFTLMVSMNLFGLLRRNTFKAQVQDFISTMQMAVRAASESNKRYEVVIDLVEQTYMMREITSPDLEVVLEEEVIIENEFSSNCEVVYVLFDDLVETDPDLQIAIFRAGHAGWQNGGKIVFLDQDEREYTVVVNRINRIIRLVEGNVDLLMPKSENEMFF